MTEKTEISLLGARDKIDAIDTEIHNLLMKRAELVENIQSAKQALGPIVNAMHADREIEMFRRFSENHKGCLPIASLQRMFREMIATFSHLQCPFRVFILKGDPLYRDMARYFYGTVIEVIECDDVEQMLEHIITPTSDVALLPADAESLFRFDKQVNKTKNDDLTKKCHIFARLPFWDSAEEYGLYLPDMFVLGHAPMKPTKYDYSMFSIEANLETARTIMGELGFEIEYQVEYEQVLYCTIKKFVVTPTDILQDIERHFKKQDITLTCLGVYGKV
ncbi:MAG: chorismate mutase [Rhizobiales bacterium]|nr:chorismate mutase [Hyphomicrobiales bacterium]